MSEDENGRSQSQPVDMTPKSASVGSEPSAAFTPGPWSVHRRFGRLTTVNGRQRFPICDTGTAPLGEANHRREEANARLISAAPDQNAALLALLARFTRFLASDRNQADAYNILVKGAFSDWEAAESAIAKTLGPEAPR